MSDNAPAVRVISLARPHAGSVVYGPVRALTVVGEILFPLAEDGLLLAVHANRAWSEEDSATLRGNLWPDCPPEQAAHPMGLLGFGRVVLVMWEEGAHEWRIVLDNPTPFRSPLQMEAYPGLRELPDVLAARIQKAWLERPL